MNSSLTETQLAIVQEHWGVRMKKQDELLTSIKAHLDELEKLLKWVNSDCFYEDYVYRFYHQSFKVYQLQDLTRQIADLLLKIAPEGNGFCRSFQELLQVGAGEKSFEMDHDGEWTARTRPFVEAFFHARYFLEMAVKYGKSLDDVPKFMPSGLAALFCLFDIR